MATKEQRNLYLNAKCRNVRWNQRYLDEELALVNRLQDELYETSLIRKSDKKI